MFDPNAGQQQMDPMTAYGQLGQGQTSAIAQEFISRFRNSGDPQAQQYAQLNPNQVTPGQLAEMHQYAAQRQPGEESALRRLDLRRGGKHRWHLQRAV